MVFHGETPCQDRYATGKPCNNRAYWAVQQGQRLVCGQHRNAYASYKPLPKNPYKKETQEIRHKAWKAEAESRAAQNRAASKAGTVTCAKMRMMKPAPRREGCLNVFPNFRHGGRKDGFGCPELSPMTLGPVDHGQPDLPVARNIENFHQFSKVFASEILKSGEPDKKFFELQRLAFEETTPYRHKPAATGNVPKFWLWKRKDGSFVKMTYIQSRQFYCTFYERLATATTAFAKLKTLLADGYDLQICGYDGYEVTESLEQHYLDASRPFGHELVLYTLLVTANPEDYPWRKHKTEEF